MQLLFEMHQLFAFLLRDLQKGDFHAGADDGGHLLLAEGESAVRFPLHTLRAADRFNLRFQLLFFVERLYRLRILPAGAIQLLLLRERFRLRQ